MTGLLAGVDIGGTKCAVTVGKPMEDGVHLIAKRRFMTPPTPAEAIERTLADLSSMLVEQGEPLQGIGVSCGGPLDSTHGVVLSPPNLPGWVNVPLVEILHAEFGVPVALQNDANAGALAEWLWGAGQGCLNMIFLTFGTGMGAGLILNSRLYSGTNDMAGEVGHLRLTENGPIGYGKPGSFEGWCSGGGIQRLAVAMAEAALKAGNPPAFCPTVSDLPLITAEKVALSGDPLAPEIFEIVGHRLGQGLAILIDVLNPELIVIGGIYGRQHDLLERPMRDVLRAEVLSYALGVCEIVPCALGEAIGDYAALAVARYGALGPSAFDPRG